MATRVSSMIAVSRLYMVDPSRIVLLAPLIFCVHFLEEAPGFVQWFNSLVQRGISQDLFLTVNVTAFLITATVAGIAASTRSHAAMLVTVGWLSFLMFANAAFHLVGTSVHGKYSPGVVTATLLYLPYFGWFTRLVHRRCNIAPFSLLATILVASLPMFVHGYLIVFKASRLFWGQARRQTMEAGESYSRVQPNPSSSKPHGSLLSVVG